MQSSSSIILHVHFDVVRRVHSFVATLFLQITLLKGLNYSACHNPVRPLTFAFIYVASISLQWFLFSDGVFSCIIYGPAYRLPTNTDIAQLRYKATSTYFSSKDITRSKHDLPITAVPGSSRD
ncbi:hypothetical protein ACJX0J_011880, partial [Zea mays]